MVEGMKGTSDREALVRAFPVYLLLASAAGEFTSNVVASSRMIGVLTHGHQPRKVSKLGIIILNNETRCCLVCPSCVDKNLFTSIALTIFCFSS